MKSVFVLLLHAHDYLWRTKAVYKDDGRLKMAESLVEQHPDVASITWKWGRWQHSVNYRPFKHNRLRLKSDVQLIDKVNEYGLVLEKKE